MLTRIEKFRYLLQTALIKSSLSVDATTDALALIFDANIVSMISMDSSVPVEQKVKEYTNYLLHHGPKPFWLTKGEQDGS